MTSASSIAVLIPCFNEQATIGAVVEEFRTVLPGAAIYVYDNNSSDDTVRMASDAGAIVRSERHQGKGRVVCRMFADIDADIYVLVDGDGTYDAAAAPALIEKLCSDGLDMVNAARLPVHGMVFAPGRQAGNHLLTKLVNAIFDVNFSDMLSGYKVFSRRYVKSFAALPSGFEIEAATSIHAVELGMPVGELPTRYRERPQGSSSKLRPVRDGLRILLTIIRIVQEERPLQYFGILAVLFATTALILIYPALLNAGYIPRFAIVAASAGLTVLAGVCLCSGVVVHSLALGRREAKRLRYLELPAPPDVTTISPLAAASEKRARLEIVRSPERRQK